MRDMREKYPDVFSHPDTVCKTIRSHSGCEDSEAVQSDSSFSPL
jgi:hypothetical protein